MLNVIEYELCLYKVFNRINISTLPTIQTTGENKPLYILSALKTPLKQTNKCSLCGPVEILYWTPKAGDDRTLQLKIILVLCIEVLRSKEIVTV